MASSKISVGTQTTASTLGETFLPSKKEEEHAEQVISVVEDSEEALESEEVEDEEDEDEDCEDFPHIDGCSCNRVDDEGQQITDPCGFLLTGAIHLWTGLYGDLTSISL